MKLIILDRDGVINIDSPNYIKSPDEWLPIPESLTAIARLYQAGYTIAVATNQSGVGRGYYTLATLAKIHEKMQQAVSAAGGVIDAVFFCPHTPEDGCDCRKPKPGLFHQIADYYKMDLRGVVMVGDSSRDIEAAEAVGCRAILIGVGTYPNLSSVVDELLL